MRSFVVNCTSLHCNIVKCKLIMNPSRFEVRGSVLGLFLGILFSSSLIASGKEYKPPVAERRFMDWFKNEPEPVPPQQGGYGAGFGMYPLWKFHKFDGFSLKPVPMNLDIGYGIPPPPPTVTPLYPPQGTYGGGYGGQLNDQQGGYGQSTYPSGNDQSLPPAYGQSAPEYGQSSGFGQSGYDSTPIQIAYQPVSTYGTNYGPPQGQYNAPQQQQYNAPQQQQYNAPQQQQQYNAPQNYPTSDMTYSPSTAVNTATLPAGGGYAGTPKVPSYPSFEAQVGFSGMQGMEMQTEPNHLRGYMKRLYDTNSGTDAKNQIPQNTEGDKKSKTT